MKNRKFLLVFVILLIIIGWTIIKPKGNNVQKIATSTVQLKDLTETVTASGKIQAKKQADLHFQTSGRLTWIGTAEGATVSAYQTLATLDAREVKKNLEKALRDYSKERNDFEEDKRDTYKDKPLTDTIKRILEKNQWDLEKAVMDVELKDIALKWSYLTTPISGIVTQIDTPVAGVNVTASDTITVVDPQSLVFEANIDETDIGKIVSGQPVEVVLDAYPKETFAGSITLVAYSAQTSSTGATVFPVEISFADLQKMRIGLNGDANIIVNTKPQVLAVFDTAVRQSEDGKFYVIKKSGTGYLRTEVETGIETENDLEIVSGLAVNDEVVISGFELLPKKIK